MSPTMSDLEISPAPLHSLTTRLALLTLAMVTLLVIVAGVTFSVAGDVEDSSLAVAEASSSEERSRTIAMLGEQS